MIKARIAITTAAALNVVPIRPPAGGMGIPIGMGGAGIGIGIGCGGAGIPPPPYEGCIRVIGSAEK